MLRPFLALSLLVLGMSAASVHAQRTRTSTTTATPTPREQAVALFAESVTAYREGRFDDAARLLDQAYALTPEPVLLYNLGRAREGAGDDDAAADAYRRYLATDGTDPTDASAARARLAVLDRRIAERRELEARAAERAAAPPLVEPAPPPPARPIAVEPWVMAGAGAVILVVGGVSGGLMLDRDAATRSATSQADALSAHQDADRFAIAADVLYAVGGIVLVAGVSFGLVDLLSSPSPTASTARLRIGPTGLSITGAF